MPVVKTTVFNKTGASKHFAFLPPFGKTIANDAFYEFNGDIYALLSKHPRHLAGLAAAITAGLEVEVVYRDEWRKTVAKTANYQVVNDQDNCVHFTTRGAAGAVTFTLPVTKKAGHRFRFTNEADQNMTVTAAAGQLVTFNNLAATSVTVSTAAQKIGASFEIVVNDNVSKYVSVPHIQGHTVTVA